MGRGKKSTHAIATPRPTGSAAPNAPKAMQVALPGEDRGFAFTRRDGLTLIAPAKASKMRASDWLDEERKFRSLVVDEEGYVQSAGFPKFYNFGEDEGDTARLTAALADDEPVFFSEKVDGSLVVRSVVRGQVVFRTRATLDGGPHGQAARRVAEDKYPLLLDPGFVPDRSLLFEFVSPEFRIIVNYPEPDLVLVGAVDHATLRQADFPELERLAEEHSLRLVSCHELPTEPEALLREIEAWKDKEGVVVRCNEGQTLVKLKGADYLARHRLRFALSARAVREICLERDVQGLADFEDYLKEQGADWELVADAKPLVEAFCRARVEARERLAKLADEVSRMQERYPVRKDFALAYATRLSGAGKGAAFALLDGNRQGAYALLERQALDEAFAALEARDELLLADLEDVEV